VYDKNGFSKNVRVFGGCGVDALKDAIRRWGKGIGTSIVKVDLFLNHRIDTALMTAMGQEIAAHFAAASPSLVMTVEASGIALAVTTAQALGNIPVVFAKKHAPSTQQGNVYTQNVRSFTKNIDYQMRCSAECLEPDARVLIVDDFLAEGEAIRGMLSLIRQAGATAIGAGIAIEKAFQKGGRALREEGLDVLSLAAVREIRDGDILFLEG
jgi:xanthine phosphoribosyltransferase